MRVSECEGVHIFRLFEVLITWARIMTQSGLIHVSPIKRMSSFVRTTDVIRYHLKLSDDVWQALQALGYIVAAVLPVNQML